MQALLGIWVSGSSFGFLGAILATLAYFAFGSTFDQAIYTWAMTTILGCAADLVSGKPLLVRAATGIGERLAFSTGHHGDNQIGGTHVQA